MPVDAASNANSLAYTPDERAAAYSRPATAPDTSSTQPAQNTRETQPPSQPEPQQQQVQVYFFDPNLGQHVNILV